jgi:very-short-patch-repair endonuclease
VSLEKRHRIPPGLLAHAREMRRDQTPAEAKLWSVLGNRHLAGLKFRRQTPRSPFVADFYCAEAKLIVELDGESHNEKETYDERRTRILERDGCRVIRFINDDVNQHPDGVAEAIAKACGVDW